MINIKRSYPAPSSLEIEKNKSKKSNNPKSGKHNLEDVINQLGNDFKNKCYLCETKATSFEVEHLVSHKNNIDLKFDWENLFLSCRHCNNIKSTSFDNILDCTKEDVENQIKYKMDLFPRAKVKITSLIDDERVNKTSELLNICFNGSNTPTKKLDSKNLRDKILKELTDFRCIISDYLDAVDDDETEDIEYTTKKIKKHLGNNSEFVSFKRWIIKDNPDLYNIFGQYIPIVERGEQHA